MGQSTSAHRPPKVHVHGSVQGKPAAPPLPIKEACFGAAVFLVIDLIIHATAPDLGQAHLCIVRALVYLCVCIPTFQAHAVHPL
jgi:hypothetical protein